MQMRQIKLGLFVSVLLLGCATSGQAKNTTFAPPETNASAAKNTITPGLAPQKEPKPSQVEAAIGGTSNSPIIADEPDCVAAGSERAIHPVVDTKDDVAEQIRLFPGDKVRVVGADSMPVEIWLGRYTSIGLDSQGKSTELVVVGSEPIVPRFDMPQPGWVKLEVTYRCHLEQARNLRKYDGRAVPKK